MFFLFHFLKALPVKHFNIGTTVESKLQEVIGVSSPKEFRLVVVQDNLEKVFQDSFTISF
jgi:hypothetical protein